MNEDIYTKFEEELYITGVYAKIITRQNLSLDYHKKVGGLLYDATEKGFSGSLEHFSPFTAQYKTLRGLRSNIYVFSAAKQYQQVREMSRFINVKGVQSTFSDFKVKAGKVFDDYNKNYLKTEYVTAISAAQNAREWVEAVQKADIFPLMRYETQRDLRVRDEHRKLDGVTLPINHPFWNNFMPPNGYSCRCYTTSQEDEPIIRPSKEAQVDMKDETKFPPLFQMNPGKDEIIFDPAKHPYFKVARGDKELKMKNFNLPVPQ